MALGAALEAAGQGLVEQVEVMRVKLDTAHVEHKKLVSINSSLV